MGVPSAANHFFGVFNDTASTSTRPQLSSIRNPENYLGKATQRDEVRVNFCFTWVLMAHGGFMILHGPLFKIAHFLLNCLSVLSWAFHGFRRVFGGTQLLVGLANGSKRHGLFVWSQVPPAVQHQYALQSPPLAHSQLRIG